MGRDAVAISTDILSEIANFNGISEMVPVNSPPIMVAPIAATDKAAEVYPAYRTCRLPFSDSAHYRNCPFKTEL